MKIQSYLFFDGQCEEAIEFYVGALGARLDMLMRYDESPDPPPPGMVPDGWGRKVMHASMTIGESELMFSDSPSESETGAFNGFNLALTVPDAAAAQRTFDNLAQGGQVRMPLGPTFWSPCFGMVTDRYGVGWMVMVPPAQAAS